MKNGHIEKKRRNIWRNWPERHKNGEESSEKKAPGVVIRAGLSLSKNPKLAVSARKQRYAGLRGKCCGTRVRGSVPQPQSSSLALPCQILVSVDGCQSLAAFGSCIHWMRAPSRRPITPAGTGGKAQGGLPSGNPVCLWQTELFK